MWTSIQSQADVDTLMLVFRSFHDSCIKEIGVQNREFVDEHLTMHFDNRTAVRMLFQSQFTEASVLEMLFEDIIDFNWVQDEKWSAIEASVIFQAVCLWKNDTLYWAEDLEWNTEASNKNDYRWIAAKIGRWRMIESGLGPETKLFTPFSY